jgi:hypothetical protein
MVISKKVGSTKSEVGSLNTKNNLLSANKNDCKKVRMIKGTTNPIRTIRNIEPETQNIEPLTK